MAWRVDNSLPFSKTFLEPVGEAFGAFERTEAHTDQGERGAHATEDALELLERSGGGRGVEAEAVGDSRHG